MLPDVSSPDPRSPALLRLETDTTWTESLDRAIAGVAQPINRQDMEALRAEVERIAGVPRTAGYHRPGLAAGSVSDLAHVNRVQG